LPRGETPLEPPTTQLKKVGTSPTDRSITKTKEAMAKTKEVRKNFPLRLSDSEKAALSKRAALAEMNLTEYLRWVGLNYSGSLEKPIRVKTVSLIPEINQQAYRQLCGIATNINQITRSWNGALKMGLTPNLDPVLFDELRQLLEEIGAELTLRKLEDDKNSRRSARTL
jgi:Bacterial mobilisation protein (MobC)